MHNIIPYKKICKKKFYSLFTSRYKEFNSSVFVLVCTRLKIHIFSLKILFKRRFHILDYLYIAILLGFMPCNYFSALMFTYYRLLKDSVMHSFDWKPLLLVLSTWWCLAAKLSLLLLCNLCYILRQTKLI